MAAELERNYTCERCGLRAIVVLEAQAMNAMAREDDANSAVGLVRCPGCERRPRAAMISSAARIALWSIGAAIAFWFVGYALTPGRLGDYQTLWTLEPLILVLAASLAIVIEIRRWEAAGRARVVRTVGPLPERDLPKAKVVSKAVLARAPAPPPVIVVERELPAPVAAGEPPRFLK
jgi:hypothetical protein